VANHREKNHKIKKNVKTTLRSEIHGLQLEETFLRKKGFKRFKKAIPTLP